ncbi:hypothetical protein MTR_8g014190 [Medicago truncatula]|uniref:Uncharacterized protein n=1 Tax=Medicago truncatula TaxID=3880 RepID=G7LGL7_MEDTR|nr:hypothetical protein MTR_8g014190 [Medicago truncatula]
MLKESQQELAMVPPNSPLMYRVKLVSFVKEKDFQDMNNQEKIEAAPEKKREGNALLAAGEDARASKRFMKKCKTVWEGFEQSASWFNKMPELKEGTKVWDRHVQRPQEYYGGIIDTGAEIWAEDAQPILSSRHL